jgi:hypothetical protein
VKWRASWAGDSRQRRPDEIECSTAHLGPIVNLRLVVVPTIARPVTG